MFTAKYMFDKPVGPVPKKSMTTATVCELKSRIRSLIKCDVTVEMTSELGGEDGKQPVSIVVIKALRKNGSYVDLKIDSAFFVIAPVDGLVNEVVKLYRAAEEAEKRTNG